MNDAARRVDIRPDHLEIVRNVLRHHLPTRRVVAFGSRATWTAKEYSDLDLAILGDEPVPLDTVAALAEGFGESDLPFKVDVAVWVDANNRLRQFIRRDGVDVQLPEAGTHGSNTPTPADDARRLSSGSWRTGRWGELVTLEYGRALQGYRECSGPYRVFGTNGPIGWYTEALCEHPSVIVGRKGAYRGIHFSPSPFSVIDTAFYLKPKVQMDTRWAYYALLTQDINGMDSGSAIPSTSREEFYRLPVSVPPIADQRAIARILGALDDKIELNRRMNETLEAMARALFKSWFVDFEPVRANAVARNSAVSQYAMNLFPSRLVDSNIGPVPEGWNISKIGTEVAAVGGSTPSTKVDAYWSGGRHAWATPKDLSKLTAPVLLDAAKKVTDAGLAKISSGLLPAGTVLMSSRAPIGYLAIADTPVAVNQGFIAMVCEKRLPNLYVLCWCREKLRYIKNIAGGSTFAEISKKVFRPIPVLVPPPPVLQSFVHTAGPLYARIVTNLKQAENLAAIRDTLLPKLISGETRVRQAEDAVAAGP